MFSGRLWNSPLKSRSGRSTKKTGGLTLMPSEPPVSAVQLRIPYWMMNCAAMVAIAR